MDYDLLDFTPIAPLTDPPSAMAAYRAWRNAVESLDVDRVVALYEEDEAVFWGAFALEPLHGRHEIRSYFESFLNRRQIRVTIRPCRFRSVSNQIVIATGSCVFRLGPANGSSAVAQTMLEIAERFTFVFRQQPTTNTWRILEHHSSLFPPGSELPPPSLS